MPQQWEPTGPWMKRFRLALDAAFDDAEMELLSVDYFAPRTFAKLAPPSMGQTFQARLQAFIEQARMNDWLPDLVAAAHERRPRDAALGGIAEELGLTVTGGPRVDNPSGRPLEEIINERARFLDPALLRERLTQAESRVCLVAIPGGGGTGFLVGPDLVLTNQHVVAGIGTAVRARDVRCRFDLRGPVDGPALAVKQTTDVALADAWLVDSRPPSAFDFTPDLGDAGPEETDAALVRLAEPVGETRPGGAEALDEADRRGWFTVPAEPPGLAKGDQVFLLQHPRGAPLRLSIGEVTAFNAAGTRVRHDANSRDGSSGSPVLDADLQLVALHHAHDLAQPPAWNQAVPIDVVRAVWEAHGVPVGGG